MSDAALALVSTMVIEDGRRWGEAATPVQWEDAAAILDVSSSTPYHYLTRSRGFSKTADLAAVSLAAMLEQLAPGSWVYGLAADRDQGRLLIDSIHGFVTRTPELAGALAVDAFKATALRTGSVFEVLAADAPSAFGLRPAFAVIDELAQWGETSGPKKLYLAVTSALTKVPGARAVVITSAGDPSHWSHKELEHARRDRLWRTHEVPGPPPWVDPERLAEQRRRLLPSQYARLFDNIWTEGEDRLTTLDDVRACVGHAGDLDPQRSRRYIVALDVGLTNDRSVVIVAHGERRAGGVTVVVDRVAVWEGTRRKPVDLGDVESWIAQASREYFRAPLVFDPFQAAHLTQRLKNDGVRVEAFTFSQQNIGRLAVTMFRLLRETRLDLPDNDALVDEIAAVRLRETSPGVYRMDHDSSRHDDQAVALAMAAAHIVDRPPSMVPSSMALKPHGSIHDVVSPSQMSPLRRRRVAPMSRPFRR